LESNNYRVKSESYLIINFFVKVLKISKCYVKSRICLMIKTFVQVKI